MGLHQMHEQQIRISLYITSSQEVCVCVYVYAHACVFQNSLYQEENCNTTLLQL
jgi:hypothetical protein